MKLQINKVYEDATIPTRGSDKSAGYDLYAYIKGENKSRECATSFYINPHETVMVHSGIRAAIPDGYFGAVFARSGIAKKHGLRPANCVGVIDADYRGEIMIALHNDTDVMQLVSDGDRVAQLVIIPYATVEFDEVEDLTETDRGSGGFGSTGE